MKIKFVAIIAFQFCITTGVHSQVATQILTTYSSGNGSNGISDYGIVSNPASGQATIGAEGTGDTFSNMILSSNISGTRRFWSFSKRTSSENHGMQLFYYNGTFFSSPIMSFSPNGNVGVGLINPYTNSRLHVKASGASPWAILSEASNSDRMIGLGHDGTNGIVAVSAYAGSPYTPLQFWTSNLARVTIKTDGNVGIGTTLPTNPGPYKLAVKGKIVAQEVQVEAMSWADYVFEPDYKLMPLVNVEHFIKQNKHLPEIPSEKEVLANGQKLGDMNVLLLKKVEELTLYIIEQNKRIAALESRLSESGN